MLEVYIFDKGIPEKYKDKAVIVNDAYFNANSFRINFDTSKNRDIIRRIDGSEYIAEASIRSKFNGLCVHVENLSTGCKVLLNVVNFKDKIFNCAECGTNVINELFMLGDGKIYMDRPRLPLKLGSEITVVHGDRSVVKDNVELYGILRGIFSLK